LVRAGAQHAPHGGALGEGIVADGDHAVGDDDGLQRCAVEEGAVADAGDGIRDVEDAKKGAIQKSWVDETRDRCWNA